MINRCKIMVQKVWKQVFHIEKERAERLLFNVLNCRCLTMKIGMNFLSVLWKNANLRWFVTRKRCFWGKFKKATGL